jgi:hypothetical protein
MVEPDQDQRLREETGEAVERDAEEFAEAVRRLQETQELAQDIEGGKESPVYLKAFTEAVNQYVEAREKFERRLRSQKSGKVQGVSEYAVSEFFIPPPGATTEHVGGWQVEHVGGWQYPGGQSPREQLRPAIDDDHPLDMGLDFARVDLKGDALATCKQIETLVQTINSTSLKEDLAKFGSADDKVAATVARALGTYKVICEHIAGGGRIVVHRDRKTYELIP